MQDGLERTAAYMDHCAAQEGHLVIFDRRAGKWEDKVFHRTERAGKGTFTCGGCEESAGVRKNYRPGNHEAAGAVVRGAKVPLR